MKRLLDRVSRLLAAAAAVLVISGCAADATGDAADDDDDEGFIDVDSDGDGDDKSDGDGTTAAVDDDGETGTAASAVSASKCGGDPECSIGRPRAVLSVKGTSLRNVLTSTGRRTLTEAEVNGTNKSYISGCRKNLCALYWVRPDGAGAYANVSRKFIRIWSGTQKRWYLATEGNVRRLGGPPVEGGARRRTLVADTTLADIFHPTNGGKGEAPLLGYSCANVGNGPCKYVVGADAPPNTRAGGKGYVAGIFQSGKAFYALDRKVEVDVFRRSDRRPGKAEWIYGYVNTTNGRVYQWVIRSVRIQEKSGSWRTYPGYVRMP